MGFPLPLPGSKARELMGDIETVVEALAPANVSKLPDFRQAVRQGQKTIEASNGAIKSVAYICLRADDERWLVSVGPKGGWKKVWNFGKGR